MPKVTAIKQQKRASRVNVFIDDKFAFGLSKKTLVDFDLFVGKEISEKRIEEILEKDQQIKVLEKSFRLLGVRPRSQKELEKKLKEKKFTPKIIKETIKKLKEYGYLDDKKFAKSWLEARKISGKGKLVVRRELREKGIREGLAKIILKQYSKKDEVEVARGLVEKKMKTYKDLSPWEKKVKISRLLASRGFSWETISLVLKDVL
jgi:regulatory protein